jgi:hypothetical protein
MSKIKVYDTHTEITNGLFIIDKVMFEVGLDDLEEFTSRQEGVNLVFSDAKLTYTGNPFIGDEYSRALQIERFRIENERLSSHLRNMSEQELIEYFDRISQEEEN